MLESDKLEGLMEGPKLEGPIEGPKSKGVLLSRLKSLLLLLSLFIIREYGIYSLL